MAAILVNLNRTKKKVSLEYNIFWTPLLGPTFFETCLLILEGTFSVPSKEVSLFLELKITNIHQECIEHKKLSEKSRHLGDLLGQLFFID
jgi:hypothetical protein